jgi:hypothetical protein
MAMSNATLAFDFHRANELAENIGLDEQQDISRRKTDMPSRPKPSREKVRAHRERLREQGLRPIQIWVPDTRAPGFREEAHRQSRAVAVSAQAHDDQAFIDAASDWGNE